VKGIQVVEEMPAIIGSEEMLGGFSFLSFVNFVNFVVNIVFKYTNS